VPSFSIDNLYKTEPSLLCIFIKKGRKYMDKRQEYKNMYLRERVDEIKVRVPKGQKAIIQEYAKSKGKSCNRFIIDLIEKEMNGDK